MILFCRNFFMEEYCLIEAAWSYIANALPFILIALPIILGWRFVNAFITWKSQKCTFFQSFNILREIFMIIFSVYVIWLVSQTVIPHMEWCDGGFVISIPENYVAKYNYIPFAAISDALYKIFVDGNLYYVIYLLGNILVFIPIGFFVSFLIPKKVTFLQIVIISFISSTIIETVQLFLPRMVDVDDVILNTIGGIIGFSLFILIKKIVPGVVDKVKTI